MFSSGQDLPSALFHPAVNALVGFVVLFLPLCLLQCPSRSRGKTVGFPPIQSFLTEMGFPSLWVGWRYMDTGLLLLRNGLGTEQRIETR